MKKALPLSFLLLIAGFAGCVKSKPVSEDAGATTVSSATAKPQATPSPASSTAFTVQQCESVLVDAERTLATARNNAPTDCKKDDDCELIETSACVPACVNRAIAKKAVRDYTSTREQLRMSSCKLWNDAECPRTTPKPTPQCSPMKAVCKANKCEPVPGP